MLTKEDLQLLSGLIDDKLQPINQRLDEMQGDIKQLQGDVGEIKSDIKQVEERLDELEESNEIIRYSTNELVNWVDVNFRHTYPFPVDRDVV